MQAYWRKCPKILELTDSPSKQGPWQIYLTNPSRQLSCLLIGWRQWFVQYSRRGTELPSVANYRAVSLTSVACKVLERILKRAILLFIIGCIAIADFRHGFLPRRSCLSNLMIPEETIRWLMDDGNTADVVNLDFANAFDSVIYRFLLTQLGSFGPCEKVVRWIRSYPTGRTFRVKVAHALSHETRIKSGAPQELVIGPLLFLLFINDLIELSSRAAFKLAQCVDVLFIFYTFSFSYILSCLCKFKNCSSFLTNLLRKFDLMISTLPFLFEQLFTSMA